MTKLSEHLQRLIDRKTQRASGVHFAIPFDEMPRLSRFIVGFEPKTIYGLTADTGVGKTKFTLQLLRSAFKTAKQYNINFKVLYFMLEGDRNELADKLLALLLSERDLYVSPKILNSTRRELPDDILEEIRTLEEEFDWIMSNMIIVDHEYNATGIYKTSRHYVKRWGLKMETVKENGVVFQRAIPMKNAVFLIVVDHINLLQPEKDSETGMVLNKHKALQKWVSYYSLKYIVKNWHCSVLNVMQQASDGSKSYFSQRGDVIEGKVEPSLDGLGNNKEIARDHHVVLGLFNPHKHNLTHYMGYRLEEMRKTMRSLLILKNRDGEDFRKIPFLYEGASGAWYEQSWGRTDEQKLEVYNKASRLFNKRLS